MQEVKKSPEANLEGHRFTYILMGLVLSLAIFYAAFEWNEEEEATSIEDIAIIMDDAEEEIESTEQEEPEEEKVEIEQPEVIETIEELVIVDNDVQTADLNINSEDDQNKEQEIIQAPVEVEEEEDPEENVVFVVVEKMPEFPGGQQALMKYLSENVKYPVIAQENGIQGRVIVQFTVRKDGAIDDVQVVRSADPSLDKEAIRLIKSMPNWTPGKQRGKAVHCKYTVPVVFKLQM